MTTYGIEPLPNLETKLVAANTLIGLPGSLTLKPREIEKLENELFALRKRYFITSSETEKKTLEAKDRELRQRLKKLLDENGFPSEFAEKIHNGTHTTQILPPAGLTPNGCLALK